MIYRVDFTHSLNEREIVVVFIDTTLNNGLESILLEYNPNTDSMMLGPYLDLQDSNGSGQAESGSFNFIHLRVMSESRFAVFYSNLLNEGTTALVIAGVTPAKDLVPVGPEYLISSPMTNPVREAKWFSFHSRSSTIGWRSVLSPRISLFLLSQ